jgi:hypothetical protein
MHEPVQTPLAHTNGHTELFCQLPVMSQVCVVLPLHRVPPGTHEPVQPPPLQTKGQFEPLCQLPLESQL